MAAIYNYAYDGPGKSAPTEPQYIDTYDIPDQLTRSREPPKYDMPKQTSNVLRVSSDSPISANTVQSSPPKNSSNMCRLFLIIFISFVIGCVVGGVVIHLWTGQKEDPSICPTLPSTSGSVATSPSSCSCPTPDTAFPRDCQEAKDRGYVANGEYYISPQGEEGPFPVYCDMDTDGGGWTVFQRREDGSVDFFLNFTDYEHGFGNVNSEHWLGNKKIYRLTAQGQYELRIDMADFDGNVTYAKYDYFRLGNADTQYKLKLGSYSGDAGDSLTHHDNQGFSTKDRDNDLAVGRSCANIYKGAWWYAASCHHSNLNGLYLGGPHESFADGVNWYTWKGLYYSLKHVEMKIRIAP